MDEEPVGQVVEDRLEGKRLDEDAFALARLEHAEDSRLFGRLAEREPADAQIARERAFRREGVSRSQVVRLDVALELLLRLAVQGHARLNVFPLSSDI